MAVASRGFGMLASVEETLPSFLWLFNQIPSLP